MSPRSTVYVTVLDVYCSRVKRDGQQFLVFVGVCVLQVTLAYESIVLYMCSGKYNDIYF